MKNQAQAKYYAENKERIQARQAEYRRENPDKIKALRQNRQKGAWILYATKRNVERPWVQRCTESRQRAKKRNIEFTITSEYLRSIWPTDNRCPVFNTEFTVSGKVRDTSPSVDRVDPTKGYVEGNVRIISTRANRIKNNATLQELKRLVEYLEQ